MQVQNGCDHRCTFCIIPFGRGNSRSVPVGEVVAQVRRLVEHGYREVVLTGVDITSYGADLPGAPRLGKLVRQILRARARARSACASRRSTRSRPTRDLIDAIAERAAADAASASVAAGRRRPDPQAHEAAAFARRRVRFCQQVRRLRPDIVFGADIIAGFPTETEAMFARSLDLVDECGLTHLHVFPVLARAPARRPRACRRLPRDVRQGAAARLRQKGEAALRRHLEREVGARRRVLAESERLGRTEQFTPVRLAAAGRAGRDCRCHDHRSRWSPSARRLSKLKEDMPP